MDRQIADPLPERRKNSRKTRQFVRQALLIPFRKAGIRPVRVPGQPAVHAVIQRFLRKSDPQHGQLIVCQAPDGGAQHCGQRDILPGIV